MLGVVGACGRLGVNPLPIADAGRVEPDSNVSDPDGGGPKSDAATDAGLGEPPDGGADASLDASVDAGLDASVEPECPTACANSHGTADCGSGTCQISCQIGHADCDGVPDNGCETATVSDLMSCGGCDLECTTSHGATACSEGLCTPSCVPGMSGDCDDMVSNGCEADLTTDRLACGSCGTVCTNANGSTSCVAGVCTPVCATDYADCDGDPMNGCETQTATDPANCGGCGGTCDTSFQACVNHTCQVSMCPQGLGDCDTNMSTCETDLTSSVGHCGFCSNACTTANGTPRCTTSSCGISSCNAGYANCDANVANGCEVTLATNTANCGSCGAACTNAHGSTSCGGGTCAPTCSSGWSSCDSNPRNGCETALSTVTNCGSCGNVCPNSMAGGTAVCNSGICGYSCNALSGVYALRIDATTTWGARDFVRAGSGPIQFWLRVTLSQSGSTLSGSAQLCDESTPEFRNTLTTDRYLIDYPGPLFTPGAPGAAFSATLASLSPGAGLTSARAAHLLGISMSDALNGAWPSLAAARSSQVDHDGDGKLGATIVFQDDSTYNHVQTAGTLFAARASQGYVAMRLRFSLGGSLSGCTGASGSATVQSFDSKAMGCLLESGSDCNASQYTHLDDNAVIHSVSNASYVLTRLGATGSTFTCPQVRSAL